MNHILRQVILFLNSRYASYGLRMTIGVTVPGLVFASQGALVEGVTASLGALCIGITDVPGTLSRKRNGMLAGCLLISVVSFLTAFVSSSTFLLFGIIILFCFVFSMFSIYGGRASNIGTACLLAMVFSLRELEGFSQSMEHAALMLGGGIWYFILSVVFWQIRPYSTVRQVLGDCLRETAEYIRIKASFYQDEPEIEKSTRKLIDVHVIINEKQEEVRELLLKRRSAIHGSNSISRSLVLIFIESVDILEQGMASHIDYRLLHEHFEKTGILLRYKQLIMHMAAEIENIAASVVSGARSYPSLNLLKEIEDIRHEVDDLKAEMLSSDTIDGFVALKNILRNAEAIAIRIRNLHHYTHTGRREVRSPLQKDIELTRFTAQQQYSLRIFGNNLTFDSSAFRHSLRVTLAAVTGYLISLMIAVDHGYWILMTVIIIMKPAFGSTKKRIYERLLGTVLGGLGGIAVLFLIQDVTALLVILTACIFLAFTFLNYNYRLAVIFITPYVLVLFRFLDPNNSAIVSERILDTLIGGGIAFAASYFLWPSWEYTQLKMHMFDILEANKQYFRQVAGAYSGTPLRRTDYKLARKDVHVSTANMASALQRMLSEPKSKQKYASEIYSFVVLNHTLSSHIATLAIHLPRQVTPFEQKEFISVIEKVIDLLNEAERNLKGDKTEKNSAGLPGEFRLLNQKLQLLATRRMDELKEGLQASRIQEELSLLRLLFDTFSNILNISAEIVKQTQKIRI